MHLKAIKRMSSKVPRSIGVPPLSDPRFEQAVMAGAAELMTSTSSASGSASHIPLSTQLPSALTTTLMMTTSEIQSPQHNKNNNGLQSMGATTICSSPCYSSSSLPSSIFPSSSDYHHHHHHAASGQIQVVNHDDVDDDIDNNNHNHNQEQSRIKNPLSGMGLTDEQYTMILQNIVNADGSTMHGPANPNLNLTGMISSSMSGGGGRCGEKRGYEESGLNGSLNSRKKSRFEVIE